MAACVLTLLVVAPTVSMAACPCADDAAIVGVETGAVTVMAVQGETRDHGAPCEAACCVSGHCHHGGAMLDTAVAAVPAPAPVVSEPVTAPAHTLASRTLPGLDRPPRA
jgi:hypothetical protein